MPSTSTAQMAAMNTPFKVAQLQLTVSALADQIRWFVARLAEDELADNVGVINEAEESNPVTTPEGGVDSASLASTSSTQPPPRQTEPVDVLAGPEPVDILAGLEPVDILAGLEPVDVLAGLEPVDVLAGLEPVDVLAGLVPVDVLAGLVPVDVLAGLVPVDVLAGLVPVDVLAGLVPVDVLAGLEPVDVLAGLVPVDVLAGLVPVDVLAGLVPVDVLAGLVPVDVLAGLVPVDVLAGLVPVDVLAGLEAFYDTSEQVAPDVYGQLAKIVGNLCATKLADDKLKEKMAADVRPGNCDSLTLTRVNPEIWENLPPATRSSGIKLHSAKRERTSHDRDYARHRCSRRSDEI